MAERKQSSGLSMVVRGRLAFVNVFKPRAAQPGGPLKFGVVVMIPKKDPQVKVIRDAIAKVADAKWGPGSSKGLGLASGPKAIRAIFRDGEERAEQNPEFAGTFFFGANSDRQPGIIDAKGQEVISPQDIYSGVEAQVQVNFYPAETGGKCVAAGLNNIRVLRKLEAFTGRADAKAVEWPEVEGLEEDSTEDAADMLS